MSKSNPSSTPTTPSVVARIQSTVAKQNGGQIPKGSYVGRLQQTVAHSTSTVVGKVK